MDMIYGVIEVFNISNLFYCFIGCVLGTLVGVLPGLGPASTLAIVLPLAISLEPTGTIVMLSGLYYGAAYGGSTTSILVNIPGEPSSVPTCFDGFPMTQQGRGGQALWIAAVGSFIAGTFGTLMLSFMGPELARFAMKFGPPEYFGLLTFSLITMVSFSGGSLIKGIEFTILGMAIASVGIDQLTGQMRFNVGSTNLLRGVDLVPVAVGLFGIGEILASTGAGVGRIYEGKLGKMMPRGEDLKKGLWASVRGTIIGFFPGLLPGIVPALTSFLAYDVERRVSKHPEKFGTGVIEGVAAPESANNATTMGNFVPLLALGIPTGPSMAIILAAFVLFGLNPGPVMFVTHKRMVWTVIGSMYVGNIMLLILNLPLVGLWARISLLPYRYLSPIVLSICVIGAYSPRNTFFDVWIALGAGVFGYIMRKRGWPVAPLILGLILGPMLEQALRQSFSLGGPTIFFRRPISVVFLIATVLLPLITIWYMKRIPKEMLEEDST
jgi:putative tricarboxylic transport membrane protein